MNRIRYHHVREADPREARIAHLEAQLSEVRHLVLDMTTDPFPRLLNGFHICDSREAGRQWAHEVVEEIIEFAKTVEGESSGLVRSAYCPLCGDGSSSPYANGYTLPEGLRRHLTGWGNTSKCRVMEVSATLARAHFNSKFAEAEAAAEKASQDRRKERVAVEPLYLIDPNLPAVLIDDSEPRWRPHRRPDGEGPLGIRWVEERLAGMGFERIVDGRVHSFVKRHQNSKGTFVVYADPRTSGEICLRVFGLTPKGNPSKKLQTTTAIRDSWKNGLAVKLAKYLDERTATA